MSRNFGAFRDFDRPDPIEDTWERATGKQLLYIERLREQLGKPCDDNLLLLSKKEAAALIHDLHLEWLREHGE